MIHLVQHVLSLLQMIMNARHLMYEIAVMRQIVKKTQTPLPLKGKPSRSVNSQGKI